MASENLILNSEFIRRFDLAKAKRGFVHDCEVADLAGISRPAVSDWRKGKGNPSKRTTLAIAKVFNVEPNWFRIKSEPDPRWESRSVFDRPELEGLKTRIKGQWNAEPSEQMEHILEKCFQEKQWGAVEKIAAELHRRQIDNINKQLKEKLK